MYPSHNGWYGKGECCTLVGDENTLPARGHTGNKGLTIVMPKFVPVTNPELARDEQDQDADMAKHRAWESKQYVQENRCEAGRDRHVKTCSLSPAYLDVCEPHAPAGRETILRREWDPCTALPSLERLRYVGCVSPMFPRSEGADMQNC